MAQENTPAASEQVPGGATEQGTPDTEAAPVLNRAQRRAQARGKSGAGGGGSTGHPGSVNSGVGNRASGTPGQVRFPRTGHK